MSAFKWIGFIKTGTLCSSVIHFFGSASGISAPYPMNCTVTVFGNGIERKSVILEGMRLYQPDGVKIDDIFPLLKQSSKTLGVLIELSCTQQKIDLSVTNCFIEINEQGTRTVYAAKYLDSIPRDSIDFSLNDDNHIVMSTICIDSKTSSLREITQQPVSNESVDSSFGQQNIRHFCLNAADYESCGIFLCSYDKTFSNIVSISSI